MYLIEEYPYIDKFNNARKDLIKHYSQFNDKRYYIQRLEDGVLFNEAIDLYPCKYHYQATNIEIIEDAEEESPIEE